MLLLFASLQWCQISAILALAFECCLHINLIRPKVVNGFIQTQKCAEFCDRAMLVSRYSPHLFFRFWPEPNLAGFLWSSRRAIYKFDETIVIQIPSALN
jgi:hypothetical protein